MSEPQTVVLEPADYWKLLKLGSDLALAKTQARVLVQAAEQAQTAHALMLQTKYPGFEPKDAHYRAEDATCTLIRER